MRNAGQNSDAGKTAPWAIGFAGSMALLALYFILLSVLNSFSHAKEQFFSMWYWILPLSAGFGIQVGLYAYIRQSLRANHMAAAEIAATGGISAGSMLGCCLHHVTDVIPLIGLSAATLFMSQYQEPFMALGIASNVVGITMMMNVIQKHKLYGRKWKLGALFRYDMRRVRNMAVVLSIVAVAVSFYLSYNGVSGTVLETGRPILLAERSGSQNSVSVSVTPQGIVFGKPVKFDISLNTHQGSLDYDLTRISVLEDDKGRMYEPLSWDGSPPGGHHRSGTLTFPEIDRNARSITLVIKGIFNVSERTFEWTLG